MLRLGLIFKRCQEVSQPTFKLPQAINLILLPRTLPFATKSPHSWQLSAQIICGAMGGSVNGRIWSTATEPTKEHDPYP